MPSHMSHTSLVTRTVPPQVGQVSQTGTGPWDKKYVWQPAQHQRNT